MKNKTLMYVVGGVAVLLLARHFIKKGGLGKGDTKPFVPNPDTEMGTAVAG